MSKIRILYAVPNLRVTNGIASYAMNYFRNIDENRIHIDFLQKTDIDTPYYDEIKAKGCSVHTMKSIKNIANYCNFLDGFLGENPYDIVHCHMLNSGIPIMYYAKKHGIKHRILHSHVLETGDNFIKTTISNCLLPIVKGLATDYFACTEKAGKYLFDDKPFTIIRNAVNIEKFTFNKQIRQELRKALVLDNKFVVGTVARMSTVKNPYFIIDIVYELSRKIDDFKFIWIGSGYMEKQIRNYVTKNNLQKVVEFYGDSLEIYNMYQMMDAFLLPSKNEGFGFVFIEAQISGLQVFGSDAVPKDTEVSVNMHRLNLKNTAEQWANDILELSLDYERLSQKEGVELKEYEIKSATKKICKIYEDMLGCE